MKKLKANDLKGLKLIHYRRTLNTHGSANNIKGANANAPLRYKHMLNAQPCDIKYLIVTLERGEWERDEKVEERVGERDASEKELWDIVGVLCFNSIKVKHDKKIKRRHSSLWDVAYLIWSRWILWGSDLIIMGWPRDRGIRLAADKLQTDDMTH